MTDSPPALFPTVPNLQTGLGTKNTLPINAVPNVPNVPNLFESHCGKKKIRIGGCVFA